MANSRLTSDYYEYATVDTAPGASGYATNLIKIRQKTGKIDGKVYFSIRGTFVATITVQFKCPGDSAWTDYNTYTNVTRKLLSGGASAVQWRALVKNGSFTSGEASFGFDW